MNVGDLKKMWEDANVADDTEIVLDTFAPLLPNATYSLDASVNVHHGRVRVIPVARVYR